MKLAVKKDEGSIPGCGFHYMLHPFPFEDEKQAELWGLMGYHIVEVEAEKGERLLREARDALRHQIEVAFLVDETRAPKRS